MNIDVQKSNEFMKKHFEARQRQPIKNIFRDYWDDFVSYFSHITIRDTVFENVDKIIKCKTMEMGYSYYECPNCNNFTFMFNTCKSRFCNCCGIQYAKKRAASISEKIYDCSHRHVVFTIPDTLRSYFREDRYRLNILFDCANRVIRNIFNKLSKTLNYTPGFISVLHTFGRSIEWNPHIHVLLTEGAINNIGKFRMVKYFHFPLLRKSWQKLLLDELSNVLGNKFKKEKSELYRDYPEGFYVYADDKKYKSVKECVNYVVRYTGRPVMAESRITNIDYKNDTISYWYEDHKTEKRIDVTEHIYQFIGKLILHVPEPDFKTVRYYGIYAAKNHKFRNVIKRVFSFSYINKLKKETKWRSSLLTNFKIDPLKCTCGAMMTYNRELSDYP